MLRRPAATVTRLALALVTMLPAACAPAEEGSRLAGLTEELTATPFFQPYDLPAVTLTDQHGEPFELRAEAAGKVTLLYFGYTSCPDVCPVTMARVGRALGLLEPEARAGVLPVFISLDAHRDSPEQVRRWVSALHPDIVGLAGSQEELDDAVEQLGFVFPETERPEEGFYEVAHPADLFLFTPELLGRYGYRHGDATPETIAADLRTLLAHAWPGSDGSAAEAGGADGASLDGPAVRAGGAAEEGRTGGDAVEARGAFALDPLGQDRMSFYVTLSGASAADTLVGLSSPAAAEASLHRMEAEGGVMHMRPVDGIPVGPGATVRLGPGELHGMLEDLTGPVAAGDTLEVTLEFAQGAPLTLKVPVLHPADAPTS